MKQHYCFRIKKQLEARFIVQPQTKNNIAPTVAVAADKQNTVSTHNSDKH